MFLFPLSSWAQDVDLAPVTGTYAIHNVIIKKAPGVTVESGTVVIKDGVISAVGKNIIIPADAHIIQADSMYLYAGFISGLSHTGIPTPKEDKKEKVKDPGNPPPDRAGIQPQRKVNTMLDPRDKSISNLRKIGFTSAHVVPHGGMLPGQGALILLTGNSPDQMIYKNEFSLFSQLKGAQRMYPSTVIGVMAKYRDLYGKAVQSKGYQLRYNSNPQGMIRPEKLAVEEAFYSVIDKKIPVTFVAEKVLDIQRVLTLQSELGFSLMLAEIKQGWDLTTKLKNADAKVFLSLDLPEVKEEKEDSSALNTSKKKTAVDLEKEALEKRKKEAIQQSYGQPAIFKNNSISFGFSTMEAKTSAIQSTLRKFLDYGMTEDDLLAALTTHPARLLGVSNVMGTIDPGKIANLFISDRSYFQEGAHVKYVFVDGTLYSYDQKKEKKTETEEKVKVGGNWSYSSETPDGTVTGKIKVKESEGGYEGTISNSFSGQTKDLSDISVEGNQWMFSFKLNIEGNEVTIEFNVAIEEDMFEGTMSAGEFGSFEVEGQKDPEDK